MRRGTRAIPAVLAVLAFTTGCEDDPRAGDAVAVDPAATSSATPAPQPTDAPSATNRPQPEATTAPDTDATPAEEPRAAVLAALDALPVKGRAPMTGYDRDQFGPGWLDADRNGCDTRNDILAAHLARVRAQNCRVLSGVLDPEAYTGDRIDFVYGDGTLIDIDHVVALGNAWATGALQWDIKKRAAFANDPLNLLPVDASANRAKGDGDAATWLPSNKPFRCSYVARQVSVKTKYELWVTAPEKAAIRRVLAGCPDQALIPDTTRAPIRVDQEVAAPAPKPKPKPAPKSTPPAPAAPVHFQNCDAARAAGAAPVHVGDPGYGRHLDRDGDGVGCE